MVVGSESLLVCQVSVIATLSKSYSWIWHNILAILLRTDLALMMHNVAIVVDKIRGFDISVTGIRLSSCCCEDDTRT